MKIINITEDINQWTAWEILYYIRNAKDEDIEINMNSNGGNVFDGLSIFYALENHKGKVTININGICASISSIIALAGDERIISRGSYFMIHNPMAVVQGDAEELRKTADNIEKMTNDIIEIYSLKLGKKEGEIEELMKSETWYNYKESKDFGFATSILDLKNTQAVAKLTNFENVPKELITNFNNKKMAENKEDKTMLEKIKEMVVGDSTKEITDLKASNDQLKVDMLAKDKEIEAFDNVASEKLTALETEKDKAFSEMKAEFEAEAKKSDEKFQAKVEEFTAYAKANGNNIVVEKDAIQKVDKENEDTTEMQGMNALASSFKNELKFKK